LLKRECETLVPPEGAALPVSDSPDSVTIAAFGCLAVYRTTTLGNPLERGAFI